MGGRRAVVAAEGGARLPAVRDMDLQARLAREHAAAQGQAREGEVALQGTHTQSAVPTAAEGCKHRRLGTAWQSCTAFDKCCCRAKQDAAAHGDGATPDRRHPEPRNCTGGCMSVAP